jgi:Ca2+-binding EF-hand superfamily protein
MSKNSTVVVLLTLFSGILGTEMLYAQPPGGPLGFLQRLDANGNGMLEPDEQGRARPFIERIARDVGGIDMNRPIRLSTLGEKIQQMQGGQSKDSRSSSSRGSSGPKDMKGNPLPAEASLDSLVPGFDVIEDVIPVPGFGAKAEYLNVPVQEADFTEAEQTIKRYDRNRNGILESDEIKNARWRDDPMKQDRNGDGKLTRSELAVRYSLRRTSEAQRKAQSSAGANSGGGSQDRDAQDRGAQDRGSSSRFGGGGGSRFGGGSSGGSSGADRMAQYAGSIMERYDANKSGVIEKSEYKNFRTDPSAGDTNKDGKITKDELTKWMTSRFSQGSGRGGDSSSSRGGSGGRSPSAAEGGGGADIVGSGSYRFKLPQEGLPEGLPGWYVTSDKNSDGQIAMSEFTGKWDAKALSDYYAYDINRDGVITPGEAIETTKSGYVRGVSAPRTTADSSRSNNRSSSGSKSAPATTGPDEKYIKFAVSQIAKYDENKNGTLDGGEIAIGTQKSSLIKASADSNGDGKITPTELATALSKR